MGIILFRESLSINEPNIFQEKWQLLPWGDELIACTNRSLSAIPKLVSVIDLGSNSLKQVIFDRQSGSHVLVSESDAIAGLAEGMKPNDAEAQLNPHGLDVLFHEALPEFNKKHEKFRVDTIVVVCTEAIRSVHRSSPEVIREILQKIAHVLDVPVEAINIISGDTEARLAGRAALIENPLDQYVIMQGGGSTEVIHSPEGANSKEFRSTLRFGTQTLRHQADAKALLQEGFAGIDWFKVAAPDVGGSHIRPVSLCLLGGGFRPIGRLLCQRIDNIPFFSTAPFGGRRFLATEKMIRHLEELSTVSENQLKREFAQWLNPALRRLPGHDLDNWILGNYDDWAGIPANKMGSLKLSDDTIGKVWHEKIMRRAPGIPTAALTILAALEAVAPDQIVFGNGNIRQATLLEFRP